MSRLPFEWFLALRYLRPKRTFFSVITLICVIGVMLGVAVLIIVISVMTGFDRQLRDRLIGFNAHVRVQGEGPFEDYASVMAMVEGIPHVRGVAPYVMGQVLVETQPAEGSPRVLAPVVRGVDAERERRVSVVPASVTRGTNDLRGNGVLVGRALADRLEIGVGDALAIYSIRDLQTMRANARAGREEAILPGDYLVRGIFDVGYYEFNDLFVVTSLANAQDLYGLGDSVTGLIVMLDNPELASAVRLELAERLGPGFRLTTWKEENASLLEALVVEKNVMFYLLFFIMIVAAFGITSALITFVVQKTREIGLLKALGATRLQIAALFLVQSVVVGVLGVCCGFGLGMVAVAYRNEFLWAMRRWTGFELFPASIYNFTELPALIVPGDVTIICGGSLLICILAGVIPAWSAGRLKPVEALRYE